MEDHRLNFDCDMHTSEAGATANVPAFLSKLWKLVDDPNYDHLIHWSQNGKSFIISNQAQFAKELLPLYFKHNNMASFIRQLNMYGFRKLTNIENGGLRSEKEDIEFYHSHFVKDHESSLEFIKRKIKTPLQVSSAQTLSENKNRSDDFGEILLDVKAIKGRQESVDQILINMQKENEALWREIAILRQKHQKQQQIVDKLIQFLLSLVHNRGLGVKRKSPLMIGSGETTSCISDEGTAKRPTNSVDYYLNDSVGPMIFDVTDTILEDESEDDKPSFSALPVDVIPAETNDNQVHSQSSTVIDVEENVLDPLQSVIDSTIKNDNLESQEEYVYNYDGKNSKKLGMPEMKTNDNPCIAQVLKPMSISYKDTGASLFPSTSGCTLIQPSKSTTDANVDTEAPSENNEEAVISYDSLDNFSISEIPLSPSPGTSPLPSASKKSNSFLNTPKVLSNDPEDEVKPNETDKKTPSETNINSIENFNEHLDSIDLELNWLNEQLSNVEGLSFDPNSLIDLDFDSTTNSQ